jgi:hypothetical protein
MKNAYCSRTYVGYSDNQIPQIKCRKTKKKCVAYKESNGNMDETDKVKFNFLSLEHLVSCPANRNSKTIEKLLNLS